jgi:hypothetical protein
LKTKSKFYHKQNQAAWLCLMQNFFSILDLNIKKSPLHSGDAVKGRLSDCILPLASFSSYSGIRANLLSIYVMTVMRI